MASVSKLREDIDVTKRELKNLRQEIRKQDAIMRTELNNVLSQFSLTKEEAAPLEKSEKVSESMKPAYTVTPIGYISSCFKFKNGIPRQPSLCPSAKAVLKIEKYIFTNPEHSLIGLEEFSHLWILFIFHENDNVGIKAKVHPPRLNGTSVGVFSTRSPHRPSPVGLSLTKLEKIEGDTLFLSGIDILDGTPVIDIKPFIPMYDNPFHMKQPHLGKDEDTVSCCTQSENCDVTKLGKNVSKLEITSEEAVEQCNFDECKIPEFLQKPPDKLEVVFTNRAVADLENLNSKKGRVDSQCADYEPKEMKKSITEVLQNDPRSIYRREKCSDKLYYFYINDVHVTCWFDDNVAEVLRVKLSGLT